MSSEYKALATYTALVESIIMNNSDRVLFYISKFSTPYSPYSQDSLFVKYFENSQSIIMKF